MEWFFFIKGVIFGISIAAPVGPIGVLCIRRTLSNGLLDGFISGVGTATADAIYGCIAAFGVTVVSNYLINNHLYLQLSGGLFLIYLGVTTFQSSPAEVTSTTKGKGLLSSYTSAFFLTLTNPLTIMSFAAAFTGLGMGTTGGNYSSGLLVLGVFSGSLLWWLLLSAAINILRTQFDPKTLRWVNQLSGAIIAAFGIFSLSTI